MWTVNGNKIVESEDVHLRSKLFHLIRYSE